MRPEIKTAAKLLDEQDILRGEFNSSQKRAAKNVNGNGKIPELTRP